MDNKFIPLCIALIIVIIIAQYQYHKFNSSYKIMNGFWQAPIAFCRKTGLESIQCYIQNNSIYFIVMKDNQVIMNKCIGFSKSYSWIDSNTNTMIWDIEFDNEIEIFPQTCQLRLDTEKMMIHLINDDTIWIEL